MWAFSLVRFRWPGQKVWLITKGSGIRSRLTTATERWQHAPPRVTIRLMKAASELRNLMANSHLDHVGGRDRGDIPLGQLFVYIPPSLSSLALFWLLVSSLFWRCICLLPIKINYNLIQTEKNEREWEREREKSACRELCAITRRFITILRAISMAMEMQK